MLGGQIIEIGRRKVIIISTLMAIVGASISLFLYEPTIFLGRLIHGLTSGVLTCAASKIVDETVPSHLNDYGFGASNNIMINAGVMIVMIAGIGVPDES
jgi:MFS family permease